MLLELILLKYIIIYNNYIVYNRYINVEKIKENFRELYNIYSSLSEYFEKYKKDVSLDELEIFFYSQRPALRDKDKEVYQALFKQLREAEVEEQLVEDVLHSMKQRQEAFELSSLAYEVSQGKASFVDLITKAHALEHEEKLDEVEHETTTTDIEEILQDEINLGGLEWRLECLNVSLGPLRKGNFGHIFARIETGKTAMWVSEVTHMAKQLKEDETLAIFFNEENGKDVILRMYSAMLGKPLAEILSNPAQAKKTFYAMGGDKIRFYDRASLNKMEVERVIQTTNPGLVVIDNMDKMSGFSADRNDLVLWEIYKWGRRLAKEYCPILSVGQADATANNQKWVNEAQMDGGKTGKPSETDFTIGIGRTNQDGMEYIRHLFISRNKLKGGPRTKAAYRHGKFDVILRAEISRYEDIVESYG